MRKKEKLFLSLLIIFAILLLVQIMGNNKVLANTVIEINNTNFPDSNFVSRLKEIFPSYTKDNLLTSDEIDKITSINLSMRGIKDLTGIEHFTALTFLNLEVNNLVTLDLSKNNNLTTLEISNNQQLTSLKLPQSIENVYMNFNTKLTNFDISHYPNLKLFYGADVPLKQVEISNLTELIALDLENTGIQSINVTNQIKLEYLNVSFNQLGELDISKNKNLVTLRTNNNKLTKLCLPNTKQNNTTLEYYQQQIKDGYEIKWYNGNELIKENETIAMKGQVLTATISPKTYQIAYHANGGSGNMEPELVNFGDYVDLKANTFTRTGYLFLGWSLSQNADNATYEDKAKISFTTYPSKGKVTLYAIWKPIQYSIEFINQNGEGSMAQMEYLLYGKVYRLPSNGFQREGYIFQGWSLKQGSQIVKYSNQASFSNLTNKPGETIKLYAVWKKKNYSVYFNIDGKTQTNTISFGEFVKRPSNPIKVGYTFLGWYDSKTNAKYDFKQKVTSSISLIAKWKVNTYTIVFHANQAKQNMNSVTINYNQTYTLPENNFKRDGYRFKGWSLTSNGTVKYTNKSSIKNLSSKDGEKITLYAQWEKIKKNFSLRVSGKNVVYNGKAQTIQISNVPSGSTIYYRTSKSGNWTTTNPSRTSVGTTTVYYKVTNSDYVTTEGSAKITVTAKNIKNFSISSISNKTYTGKQIKPGVTVKERKNILKNGTHYSISYGTNKNTGKAYVKINGKGNYTGTITKYFYIVPKAPTVSISAGRGSISITAKSTGASGYEISYATSRNGKYKTIQTTNTKRTINKLTRGRNYYVKVRAYKIIDGKKVYSSYSSIKVIKVR